MFKFKDFDYLTDGEIDLKIEEKAGLVLKEIVDLPSHNDLYKEGERQACIYEWILK